MPAVAAARGVLASPDGHGDDAADPDAPRARAEAAASRLLMPMSLAASLGTTLTLFSAPAFLLVNNLLRTGGRGDARHLRHHADRRRARRARRSSTCRSGAGCCRAAGARRRSGLPAARPLLHRAGRRSRSRPGSASRWRNSTRTSRAGSRSSSGCADGVRAAQHRPRRDAAGGRRAVRARLARRDRLRR